MGNCNETQCFAGVLIVGVLLSVGCEREPNVTHTHICDPTAILDYLDRRAAIPVLERRSEALATIVASCGKRDELFMIHDDYGRLYCGVHRPEQWRRVRRLGCPSTPCARHHVIEGAYDRAVGEPPLCEMALLASLESLGVGPAATVLARDVAVDERWLEWHDLFKDVIHAHPRELRRATAQAYPLVRSLREPARPEQSLRLHRDDDGPWWRVNGSDGHVADVSWSCVLELRPKVSLDVHPTTGEPRLKQLTARDIDLLVDDDVPWLVVKTVLEQFHEVRPDASFGLVFLGAADSPALVRVSVSPSRHPESSTRKMSCDGAYEQVPSTVELRFDDELAVADVARIVDCVCTSGDCTDGFSLHDWRAPTATNQ